MKRENQLVNRSLEPNKPYQCTTAEHKRIARVARNKRYYDKNRDRLCAEQREHYKFLRANGLRNTKRLGGRWVEINCE